MFVLIKKIVTKHYTGYNKIYKEVLLYTKHC